MKRALLFFLIALFSNWLPAQTFDQYSIKLQGIYGNIIPHDEHVKALVLNPVSGAELSVEFQTSNEKPWYQFTAFPVLGVGGVWLNLGNPAKLGNALALYPYICFPLIRSNFLKLNLKAGAGVSYLSKTYYNTNKDSLGNPLPLNSTNAAIGSNLNVYFSGGGSLEIPIAAGFSLTADYTWNHMSNGSAVTPNSGLNLLNGFVGLKYTPNYNKYSLPTKRDYENISRKFSLEFIASGGFRQLYYKDNKTYPIATLGVGVYRPLTNFYQMGLAIDAFYDGVYDGTTKLQRTYLTTNEFKNKVRIGISWQHEVLMGRVTASFDFGLYMYNPLKNLEPYDLAKTTTQNKPLIYAYDIDKEDGWFYTRAALKYAIDKHLFISIGLKTHLQKAEFIEWGLGYKL